MLILYVTGVSTPLNTGVWWSGSDCWVGPRGGLGFVTYVFAAESVAALGRQFLEYKLNTRHCHCCLLEVCERGEEEQNSALHLVATANLMFTAPDSNPNGRVQAHLAALACSDYPEAIRWVKRRNNAAYTDPAGVWGLFLRRAVLQTDRTTRLILGSPTGEAATRFQLAPWLLTLDSAIDPWTRFVTIASCFGSSRSRWYLEKVRILGQDAFFKTLQPLLQTPEFKSVSLQWSSL